jgi:hypothetical protein
MSGHRKSNTQLRSDAAGALKGAGSAEAAQKLLANLKKPITGGPGGVFKFSRDPNVINQAQAAYNDLRGRAANALDSLTQTSDTLSASATGSNIPSLVTHAQGQLLDAGQKANLAKLQDNLDARRNYILSRARNPGRAGLTFAGSS